MGKDPNAKILFLVREGQVGKPFSKSNRLWAQSNPPRSRKKRWTTQSTHTPEMALEPKQFNSTARNLKAGNSAFTSLGHGQLRRWPMVLLPTNLRLTNGRKTTTWRRATYLTPVTRSSRTHCSPATRPTLSGILSPADISRAQLKGDNSNSKTFSTTVSNRSTLWGRT